MKTANKTETYEETCAKISELCEQAEHTKTANKTNATLKKATRTLPAKLAEAMRSDARFPDSVDGLLVHHTDNACEALFIDKEHPVIASNRGRLDRVTFGEAFAWLAKMEDIEDTIGCCHDGSTEGRIEFLKAAAKAFGRAKK